MKKTLRTIALCALLSPCFVPLAVAQTGDSITVTFALTAGDKIVPTVNELSVCSVDIYAEYYKADGAIDMTVQKGVFNFMGPMTNMYWVFDGYDLVKSYVFPGLDVKAVYWYKLYVTPITNNPFPVPGQMFEVESNAWIVNF